MGKVFVANDVPAKKLYLKELREKSGNRLTDKDLYFAMRIFKTKEDRAGKRKLSLECQIFIALVRIR